MYIYSKYIKIHTNFPSSIGMFGFYMLFSSTQYITESIGLQENGFLSQIIKYTTILLISSQFISYKIDNYIAANKDLNIHDSDEI